MIDELNLPFAQAAFVKSELAEFLRQNGGHLAQPLSIMLLTAEGLRIQPRPSVDGLAQLEVLNQIKGHISSINPAMGGEGRWNGRKSRCTRWRRSRKMRRKSPAASC